MRTVLLVPDFREKLPAVKEEQEGNRLLCGHSYSKESPGYLCVDEMGNLIRPGYGTTAFPLLPEHNGLRKIRYHNLRHSCASILHELGWGVKKTAQWLEHADCSVTVEILYLHRAKPLQDRIKGPE